MDEPINFTYDDTDTYQNEISELYSYSEESDFFANRNAFEESMWDCGLPLTWKHMVAEQQSRAINYLMTTLEVLCRATRIKSCRALAYLVQGNFGECLSLEEQASSSRDNVFLLYKQGVFQAFVQQLHIETNASLKEAQQYQIGVSTAQLYSDSAELRLIISVLCTITETMYHAKDQCTTDNSVQELRKQFISDLQNPINDELLTVTLFQMLNNFCSGQAPHFPVRKIILLLWKIILITLGGTEDLKKLKQEKRRLYNLDPLQDDTIEVTRNMSPCPPPTMPDGPSRAKATLAGGMMANKRKVFKQPAFDDAIFTYARECLLNFTKPDQFDDNGMDTKNPEEVNNEDGSIPAITESKPESDNSYLDGEIDGNMNAGGETSKSEGSSSDSGISNDNNDQQKEAINERENPDDDLNFDDLMEDNEDKLEHEYGRGEPMNSQDSEQNQYELDPPVQSNNQIKPLFRHSSDPNLYRGLPWASKVRKADLTQHLSNIRQKFLGYTLANDIETTFGLPDPIIEGIDVLRKHLYISLSDIQLEREEVIERYPLTHGEIDANYLENSTEKLYSALLPRLPQYMIALLKILLAASTSTKNKTERSESINIMAEINPDVSSQSIVQTMRMSADANRHKEILIKGISAILILLLKHFKINHIYQFEYVSQQLMFANCIPLILKFLSQDMVSYIFTSKSSILAIDFPACVIGEQPELTSEAIELCSYVQPYSWRNMFSCINLLRVLNKLTKWKHSRIMMLVVFKSSQTLLKALSIRHPMLQLYVLKLLKVQLKFLGRQWKKNNMKLISPIYQKVRHRLTDDWAYSNDNEARPWDFQAEEFTLQANINKFHRRRYQNLLNQNNKRGNSNSNNLALSQTDKFDDCASDDFDLDLFDYGELSPNFARNYERWLESEVFQRHVDWDKLLSEPLAN